MGAVLQFQTSLVTEECCSCGLQFAMPEGFKRVRREQRDWFYCPAGHAQHYTAKTDAELLREKLAAEEGRRMRAEREAADAVAAADRAQAELRRVRKRVDGGMCPDCKRTFKDLRRHRLCKHGPKVAKSETPPK